jgi:hypothetical protein
LLRDLIAISNLPAAVFLLIKALADPALLGTVLAGDTWRPWRTLLIASTSTSAPCFASSRQEIFGADDRRRRAAASSRRDTYSGTENKSLAQSSKSSTGMPAKLPASSSRSLYIHRYIA